MKFLLSLLVLFSLLLGCSKSKPATRASMPTATVVTQTIHLQDVVSTTHYIGRAVASQEVAVVARVSGILLKHHFLEGQTIQAGALLAELDADIYQANFYKAQARFQQAQQEWQRITKLYQGGSVSGSEFDTAKANYEYAEAELWSAQIALDHTNITAPISGIVGKKSVSVGNLLVAGTQQSQVTTIQTIDPLYVDFSYSDTEFFAQQQEVQVGIRSQPNCIQMEVYAPNDPQQSYRGYVDFVASHVDPTTNTVQARAVIANPQHKLLPGQFIDLLPQDLILPQAIVIPEQAIMQGAQGPFVYRLQPDLTAVIQSVTPGTLTKQGIIIRSGLQPHDQIVVEGMIKVIPGQIVKVESVK